ncbi:hypothetical protein ABH923_001716 [Leifsonia sp. EB41]
MDTRVRLRTRSGRSSSSCITTPPPILQPTRCTGPLSSESRTAATSSEKSPTPRVASTGSVSLSPKPRRSIASARVPSGIDSISGCQNSDDETLPCTNTIVRVASAATVGSVVRARTLAL